MTHAATLAGAPALDGRPIRAVLLDVDGTLYDQRSLRLAMLSRLARFAAGSPLEGRVVFRALRAYRHAQEELRAAPDTEADGALRQLRVAAGRSGLTEARVGAIVRRWMEEEPLPLLASRARPGLATFLDELDRREVPVGVVSDYPAAAKLERLGVARHCRVVVCAQDADVGCFKPSPRGLLAAAARLGVEPGDVLYVGDRPEVDAVAARAAGMRCCIVPTASLPESRGMTATARDFDELRAILFRS